MYKIEEYDVYEAITKKSYIKYVVETEKGEVVKGFKTKGEAERLIKFFENGQKRFKNGYILN